MTVFNETTALISDLARVRDEISDEFQAFDGDEEPGIQYTLACNDTGEEYAAQTGDNSFTGAAYSFPHWAVVGVYRDSDLASLAEELLEQLSDLIPDNRTDD